MDSFSFDLSLALSTPRVHQLQTFRRFWSPRDIPVLFIFKKVDYPTPQDVRDYLSSLIKIREYTDFERTVCARYIYLWVYDTDLPSRKDVIFLFIVCIIQKSENRQDFVDILTTYNDTKPERYRVLFIVDTSEQDPKKYGFFLRPEHGVGFTLMSFAKSQASMSMPEIIQTKTCFKFFFADQIKALYSKPLM